MFVQRRWMRRTDCRRLTEQQWNPPLHFRRQSYSTPVKVRNAVLDKWRERAADLAAHSEHAHSSGDRNIHLNAAEYNSPFPSHVIVLQMSNTSGILVLVIHSSYHNECHVTFCCSCLVSMTPGWRSTTLWANSMKLNMTRSAINLETWKKISKRHYSKQSVFPPTPPTQALHCFCWSSAVCNDNAVHFIWPDYTALFSGNNICEQQCTPVGGQPRCSCSPGFSLRADGRSCEGKEVKRWNNAENLWRSESGLHLQHSFKSSSWARRHLVPFEKFLGKTVCHCFVSSAHQHL